MFFMLIMIFFPVFEPKNVSADEVKTFTFSERFENQTLAKELFYKAGDENRLESDYIWKIDSEKAVLNPLVLAYRYEARRVNSTWACYKMRGIDQSLSEWAWAEGFFGVSFPVPPDYFCEGQIPFEKDGVKYFITVNTSAWKEMIETLEDQVRQFADTSEPEYVLYEENILLEYLVSKSPNLNCRQLEAIHNNGVRYEEQNLQLWRKNLLPSKNPYEYRLLQRLTVTQCTLKITTDVH